MNTMETNEGNYGNRKGSYRNKGKRELNTRSETLEQGETEIHFKIKVHIYQNQKTQNQETQQLLYCSENIRRP